MKSVDIVIIGSGPGGYATGAEAACDGNSVIIIERDELGGTCLNRGCIPTKALCRSAEVADTVRSAAEFGVDIGCALVLDFGKAVKRKNEVVSELREGVAQTLSGTEVIRGEARLKSANEVEVNGETIRAGKIIIATGSAPASLPIPGAELTVNSDQMLSAETLPSSIIIIGGGVIGMEFASIFASFDVKVTVIEYCKEILPPFDAEIAKRLRMSLKRRGINIITSAEVKSIADGHTVTYESKGKIKEESADMVMMAVGRKPVLPEGLNELGIKLNRNAIQVDDNMQTSIPGIYAIGDVNGLCMLAHAASAQGRVALGKRQRLDVVPSTVFTQPECAMTGLTETQCIDRNLNIKVGKATFRANGKALAIGEADGLVKVIIEADSHKILGCHICGAHAADLIQEMATAMSANISADDVAESIHSHPTLGETVHAAVLNALK